MSTGMTSQDSLTINIVCVIVTPAYMVSRDQHVIKVLQEVTLPGQKQANNHLILFFTKNDCLEKDTQRLLVLSSLS